MLFDSEMYNSISLRVTVIMYIAGLTTVAYAFLKKYLIKDIVLNSRSMTHMDNRSGLKYR